ncbi:MAG: glyceraldehyde-3-phosphate dehydrogenase [Agrococcus casei]|uniref:glyceraldehyde-3-phosphate dehydrogenase n=1 Tax=Agrococcus casei TaxID=343512 RepID=UPI003F93A641
MNESYNEAHENWLTKVAAAEESIPLIGRLYREHNVVTSVFGRQLVNQSAIEVVKAHRWARRIADGELDLSDTLAALRIAEELGIHDTSLDVGVLAAGAAASDQSFVEFARTALAALDVTQPNQPQDIVLYGFGRIGRLLARILIAHHGAGLGMRLRAIVVRNSGPSDLTKRASLLRRDSVHGAFDGTIEVDEEASVIIANGTRIQVIYSNDPASVDYTEHGIENAIVVDNTGRWRDEEGLSLHLQAEGTSRVVLTAPGKGDLPNVVFGINDEAIMPDAKIVTAASCTTNAITPVLQVINERYGIEYGHVETVHSYTNDQNLIDNYHKGDRRGRSAALNMVLTETGAAKAVAKALPELAGKLTGNAIRVPTPDVSMAILNLTLNEEIDRDTINNVMRQESLTGDLSSQIDYIDSPEVVSTDFVGNNRAGIVDGLATIATGRHLVMYVWYDNEFGYSSQVIRVLEKMSKQKA